MRENNVQLFVWGPLSLVIFMRLTGFQDLGDQKGQLLISNLYHANTHIRQHSFSSSNGKFLTSKVWRWLTLWALFTWRCLSRTAHGQVLLLAPWPLPVHLCGLFCCPASYRRFGLFWEIPLTPLCLSVEINAFILPVLPACWSCLSPWGQVWNQLNAP